MTFLLLVGVLVVGFLAGRDYERGRMLDEVLDLAAEVWDDCTRELDPLHTPPNPYRQEP